jgi:hypothetical protein
MCPVTTKPVEAPLPEAALGDGNDPLRRQVTPLTDSRVCKETFQLFQVICTPRPQDETSCLDGVDHVMLLWLPSEGELSVCF